jgi:RNA polymerase sigma factor (sigma-70 family)
MTDGELLQLYAAKRDGEAFAEIVRRHGGMVHATARRLARNETEDVTQAVFLLLAQRAGKLSRYRNLAGWLYNVTRYCASNARRTRGRRERHLENYQQREAAMKAGSASNATDPDVSELLDAALARLKDDQRQAVLLRYIEGLSLDETAQRLGINAAAVAKRAERGIARLRDYFAARGVTLSDAALAATPISATTLASIHQIATGTAPAKGAAAIASATGTTMTFATVKTAAVLVIALAGVTAATIGITKVMRPSPSAAQASTSPATRAAAPLQPASAPAGLTQETGRAVAAQFTRGLRDRDEEAVAKLLIANSPDEGRAAAAGFIAQIRDGLYAGYPDRMDQIVNSMFMSDQIGGMLNATLDTNTPTDADVQRLSIRLEPAGREWRVRDAKIINGTAMTANTPPPASPSTSTPTASNVPPATYIKAAEIFARLQSHMMSRAEGPEIEKQKTRLAESVRSAQDDLRQLAAALKTTDLAIPDEHVTTVNRWLEEGCVVLESEGVAAFTKFGERARSDRAFMDASNQIRGLGETLPTRVEADAAATQKGGRPPAFAASVTLTLARDQTRQTVEGPVTVPAWFRQSATFKTWQQRHDVRTFRTRDDAGNNYEIFCGGGIVDQEGEHHDLIPGVRLFRPDGTLAATADYDEFGHATAWGTFDKTGKVYTKKVITERDRGTDGRFNTPSKIAQVIFFDAQKNQRVWEVGKDNLVKSEALKDPVGTPIKTVHAAPKPQREQTTTREKS